MPVLTTEKKLRDRNRYNTSTRHRMTENNNTENVNIQNVERNISDSEPEPYILTQNQVNDQIRIFLRP